MSINPVRYIIALRDAGWTWNCKLRQWEKQDGEHLLTAKHMDEAYRLERTTAEIHSRKSFLDGVVPWTHKQP